MEFIRLNNDINGNPRYAVWFGSLGVPFADYRSARTRKILSKFGARIHNSRAMGGGYSLKSYNIEGDLEAMAKAFAAEYGEA